MAWGANEVMPHGPKKQSSTFSPSSAWACIARAFTSNGFA